MFPTAAEIVSNLRKQFNSMEDVEKTFNSWDLNRNSFINIKIYKKISQNLWNIWNLHFVFITL